MLDASADMVSSCLTYLQLDDFDSGPCVSEHELENRLARFPLLDYAATSWFLHVKSTQIEILIRSQASKLLQRERTLPFLSWLQVFCNSRDPNSNSYEKNRGNALYYLAEWGFCSTAEHLIQLGSDVDGVQGDVGYPLHAATHGGHEAMVRLLLENGADVTLQNDHGDTALHLALAVEQPNLALFSVLVEAMAGPKNGLDLLDASGRTALHHAVYKSDKAFRILLQAGASAEPKSHFEETPLFSSLRSHNQEVALELLKYGADPHRRCWSRQTTPMHMAARRHYTTVMEAMLLRVMSVNITDSHGVTPLHDAIGSENDTFGTTPWTERGDAMVDLLLRHNADVTLGKLRPRDLALARSLPHCIQVLSNYEDRCLDTQDEFGYTALHFAAQKSREGVRSLLGLGASVNIANNSGMTPLHFAAQNMRGQSETDIARDLEALETGTVRPPRTMAACDTIICLLVAAGANIHVRNLSGEKPLDILRRASRKWGTWRQNPELHHEPK
jgi:ankyrin repeat protein